MPRYPACLFLVDIDAGQVSAVRAVPLVLEPGRVRRAVSPLAQQIVARLLRLPQGGDAVGLARLADGA